LGLRRFLLSSCLLLVAACVVHAAGEDASVKPKILQISITSRYNAQNRQPQVIRDFLAQHPNVQLVQWDGIKMPAEGARASLAMAMAANIGPDIFETDIRQAVEQRLAYPSPSGSDRTACWPTASPSWTRTASPTSTARSTPMSASAGLDEDQAAVPASRHGQRHPLRPSQSRRHVRRHPLQQDLLRKAGWT